MTRTATPFANQLARPASELEFDLPEELIAQHPAARREQARLMVVDRQNGSWQHSQVADLGSQLRAGDLLVINDTRVIPARLRGTVKGGKVELLLVRRLADPAGNERWNCIGRPSKRLTVGSKITIADGLSAVVTARPEPARYEVDFTCSHDLMTLLLEHGEVPLPPYIRRPEGPSPEDCQRYQTIFAVHPGAIAAPTAGLHFTPQLVEELRSRGVDVAPLTLHVGPGTFLPVRCDDLYDHKMEAEWFEIPAPTAAAICRAKDEGRRVVAVGTTTTRALEAAASSGPIAARSGWTDLFILPGFEFSVVDALFTNFHLPGSTLLALISAFAGADLVRAAYAEAVRQRYRFYSYGDAMLIQ